MSLFFLLVVKMLTGGRQAAACNLYALYNAFNAWYHTFAMTCQDFSYTGSKFAFAVRI